MRQLRLWLFLLVLAAASAACGTFLNPVSAPTAPPAASRFAVGPASVRANLGQLKSYRTQLVLDFEGVRAGQPAAGHIEALTEVTRQPPALHQLVELSGSSPQAGRSDYFRVGDQLYLQRNGEVLQFTSQLAPGELGLLEPEKLIIVPPAVSTAPAFESLHGVNVQHYRFTEADLADSRLLFDRAEGELWVATAGNFVLQYIISGTLKMTTPIANAHLMDEGRLQLRYTVTDANGGFTINPPAPPAGAEVSLPASLPRPADAEVTALFPTYIEYTTAISPVSATLFYRDELPPLGWTGEITAAFTEKARLVFANERQTLTILITPLAEEKIKVLLDVADRP